MLDLCLIFKPVHGTCKSYNDSDWFSLYQSVATSNLSERIKDLILIRLSLYMQIFIECQTSFVLKYSADAGIFTVHGLLSATRQGCNFKICAIYLTFTTASLCS